MSLPSSFKCPQQSAARPLFGRGLRGWLQPPLSSRAGHRATACFLKCPRGCLFLPWVRRSWPEGGGSLEGLRRWRLKRWSLQKLAKAKPENAVKSNAEKRALQSWGGTERAGMTLNLGHQGHAFTCEATAPFPTCLHQGKGSDKAQQKLTRTVQPPSSPLPVPRVHTEVARLPGPETCTFALACVPPFLFPTLGLRCMYSSPVPYLFFSLSPSYPHLYPPLLSSPVSHPLPLSVSPLF